MYIPLELFLKLSRLKNVITAVFSLSAVKFVSLFYIASAQSTRAFLSEQPSVNALAMKNMSAWQLPDVISRLMRF